MEQIPEGNFEEEESNSMMVEENKQHDEDIEPGID